MSKPDNIVPAGRQSGMTLVEIVVALVVIGLTFAIAAGALRVLARSGGIGSELIGRHDMFSRGIDAVRRDIERFERIALGKQIDDAQFEFSGTEQTLAFVVVEPPFPTHAGLFLVRYAIIERGGRGLVVRSRSPYVAGSPIPASRAEEAVTVLDGLYRFGFSYLERREGARALGYPVDRPSEPAGARQTRCRRRGKWCPGPAAACVPAARGGRAGVCEARDWSLYHGAATGECTAGRAGEAAMTSAEPRNRGIALVVVLWLVTILALQVSLFNLTVRDAASLGSNELAIARGEQLASSGIELAVAGILDPDPMRRWDAGGELRVVRFGGAVLEISRSATKAAG